MDLGEGATPEKFHFTLGQPKTMVHVDQQIDLGIKTVDSIPTSRYTFASVEI
jgi:hypothetical protein